MRGFIAIDLPEDIKDYLYNVEQDIGSGDAKIKWVAKKNLHLTLKFLGNVDDNLMGEIKDRIREIRYNKFDLSLENFGWFPDVNNARVLWIDIKDKKKLIGLQQRVDSQLLDIFKDEQKFSPHLTIGRVKMVKDKISFMKKLGSVKIKEMSFNVNRFVLMSSKLTKDGPRYNVEEEFNLD